jgi:hypothetical protein
MNILVVANLYDGGIGMKIVVIKMPKFLRGIIKRVFGIA